MKKQKNKKPVFHLNREVMTKHRIESMEVIDSYEFLRLLFDHTTGHYIVFNNYSLNSLYSKNYDTARQFFEKQANKLD